MSEWPPGPFCLVALSSLADVLILFTYSPCDFPGGSDGKASAYGVGDRGSIPGWGRSPGEGNGNPLQYSRLENPMDGGAWWATVHGVTKSQTRLSDFPFFFLSFFLSVFLSFFLCHGMRWLLEYQQWVISTFQSTGRRKGQGRGCPLPLRTLHKATCINSIYVFTMCSCQRDWKIWPLFYMTPVPS